MYVNAIQRNINSTEMLASYRKSSNCLTDITINKSRQNLTSPLQLHTVFQNKYFYSSFWKQTNVSKWINPIFSLVRRSVITKYRHMSRIDRIFEIVFTLCLKLAALKINLERRESSTATRCELRPTSWQDLKSFECTVLKQK